MTHGIHVHTHTHTHIQTCRQISTHAHTVDFALVMASSAHMPHLCLWKIMYVCSWLFITLVASLLYRGHAASREVFPCRPQSVKLNVSLYYSDTLVVLANSSHCDSAFQSYSVSIDIRRGKGMDKAWPIVCTGGGEGWEGPMAMVWATAYLSHRYCGHTV